MREEFPDPEHPLDPGWLRPLLGVADVLSASTRPSDRLFDPGDFMIMARIHRGTRSSIVLYKHVDTRHYLNLDDGGNAYQYFPARSLETRGFGQYRPYRSLRDAIHAIGLWELPWLRPGLEEHRHGFSYEDRWPVMDSDLRIQQLSAGGASDGDLRLV